MKKKNLQSREEKKHQEAYRLLDMMFTTAAENGIVKNKKEFAEKYLIPAMENRG